MNLKERKKWANRLMLAVLVSVLTSFIFALYCIITGRFVVAICVALPLNTQVLFAVRYYREVYSNIEGEQPDDKIS